VRDTCTEQFLVASAEDESAADEAYCNCEENLPSFASSRSEATSHTALREGMNRDGPHFKQFPLKALNKPYLK